MNPRRIFYDASIAAILSLAYPVMTRPRSNRRPPPAPVVNNTSREQERRLRQKSRG